MSDFVFCLNTSTIRPTPLIEKIEVAGNAGYAAIEPWNDEITAYLEQGGQFTELKRAIAGAGLKVVSVIALHGWITSDGAEYVRVLDDCHRDLRNLRPRQLVQGPEPSLIAACARGVRERSRAKSMMVMG